MQSSEEIEKMNISESGKLIGHCQNHLIEYMKTHKTPIRTHELLNALEKDAPRLQIPLRRGSCTRREAYMAAITTLRQSRLIETSIDYFMWWHEHAPKNNVYRGHPQV